MPENPSEIPSFKPPLEPRKEDKKPGFALFGKGNVPLQVRGLSGPKTLIERLKKFKKKDLIFIGSGLGVLFMAPLAEHFLMSPSEDNVLRGGFDQKGKAFTGDMSPYEPGAGGMSPGAVVGAGGDIITPLNVRDPSALVLGLGGAQQPPSSAPQPKEKEKEKTESRGWNDALSEAAKKGAEKGVAAAKPGAFRVAGSLSGGLRGFAALSGASSGGGPSYSLPSPNANNVPNRGVQRGGISQVQAAPGYKGVGPRGPDQGSTGAEALKRAAANAGDMFNRSGSAARNLDAAANQAIPGGGAGSGGAGPGAGGQDKAPGQSNQKDNKSVGESLAFLRAKMEMEKEMDLKWARKKWEEFEFRKMITEGAANAFITNLLGTGILTPMGQLLSGIIGSAGTGGSAGVMCIDNPDNPPKVFKNMPPNKYYKCGTTGKCMKDCYISEWETPTKMTSVNANFIGKCAFCYHIGNDEMPKGDKGEGKGGGGSSGDSNRVRTIPGTGSNAALVDARDLDAQRAQQAQALRQAHSKNCTGGSANQKKLCAAFQRMMPIYDSDLVGVRQSIEDAKANNERAWQHLNLAREKTIASQSVLAKKLMPKFGCPGGKYCQDDAAGSVYAKGKEAEKSLESASQATDLAKAKEDIESARLKLVEANEKIFTPAVGAAGDGVMIGRGSEGDTQIDPESADKRAAIRFNYDEALKMLDQAAFKVNEGGKLIAKSYAVLAEIKKEGDAAMAGQSPFAAKELGDLSGPLGQLEKLVTDYQQLLINLGGNKAALGQGSGKAEDLNTAGIIDNSVQMRRKHIGEPMQALCGACQSAPEGIFGKSLGLSMGPVKEVAQRSLLPRDQLPPDLAQLREYAAGQLNGSSSARGLSATLQSLNAEAEPNGLSLLMVQKSLAELEKLLGQYSCVDTTDRECKDVTPKATTQAAIPAQTP